MSKVRLLLLVVGVLTVLNVILLAIVFSSVFSGSNSQEAMQRREDRQIREIFLFDDNQMQAFLDSKDRHGTAIRPLQIKLQQASEQYYLFPDEASDQKSLLLDSIMDYSRQIYLLNDRHFDEIRKICRPDQLKHVNGLIIDLLRRPPESRRRGKVNPPKSSDMH